MRIAEIRISKFRSINNCTINFENINAIVGENNAGKTAILRALNAFFNYDYESKYFKNNINQYSKRANTLITVIFENIPNKEIYKNKLINSKLQIVFSFTYSRNKKSLACITDNGKVNIDENFLLELKKDIDFVYIPASRNNYDLSWTEDSIFSKLITAFSAQYTRNRDNISSNVKAAAKKLHSTILTKVEKQISDLCMHNNSTEFIIDYKDTIDYTLFLNRLGIKTRFGGMEYDISECGSGIQSLAVIALYRALSKINDSNIILGIEEPEKNLHPQAQKRLIFSLKNNTEENEIQTIFATHSTVIIDELEHEEIIYVRRESDAKRGFRSKITQLSKTFWADNNIEEFRHYQFFKYRNSDFFFSKFVILAESPIDSQFIERLVKDVKDKIFDVSILNLNGVDNLKYAYFLFKNLEIPFAIVVDKDFFVPYKNSDLDNSRNSHNGLPLYANYLKTNNDVLNNIFVSTAEKAVLLTKIHGSYSELFNFLRPYRIYTMRFSLEMDLCCSSKARDQYYTFLNVTQTQRTLKFLLTNNHKAIKNAKYILNIIDSLPIRNYPISYSKIKKALIEDINEFIQ